MSDPPLLRIVKADPELWQQYDALAARSYGHPVEDITRLRPYADIRVAVRNGRVVAGGLGLLAGQYFGGAAVPCAVISAGCVAPEERGDRLAGRLLAERIRPLREQGAVIATAWTSSTGHLRHLGWQAPVPVFAWSIPTDDLKRSFTPSDPPMTIDHGRSPEGEALQRRLARDWNGPLHRPDWWPAWQDAKRRLTTYRFSPPGTTPTGYLSFATGRNERHGMDLTVHDFWAADAATAEQMMAFLGSHHTRARTVHFRRSALAPYPTLLHGLHRHHLTAEAWHPWMLRILDPAKAVRLRGWPAHLNTTITVELETDAENTWKPYTLHIQNGRAQLTASRDHPQVRLTRGQLAAWYAGGYRTAASARLAGVTATSPEALTHLIRTTTDQEPWLPDHI